MSGLLSGLWKPNTKGLYTGPLDGLNAFNVSATPTPIATWDWTPTTYAGVDPAGTATYRWDMQDTSGDLTESIVGGGTNDLAARPGTLHTIGNTAPGFSNGTNLSSRKCLSAPDVSALSVGSGYAGPSTVLDCSANSIAIRFTFRAPTGPGATAYICGNYNGSNAGWYFALNSNGVPIIVVRQSGTIVQLGATGFTSITDGAWHCVEMIIDWTADTVRVRTDLDPAGQSASLSTLTQANTAGGQGFYVGGMYRAAGDYDSPRGMQIADFYGWEGSAAESIDSTPWADVWPYFGEPSGIPSYLSGAYNAWTGTRTLPCDADDESNDGLYYVCSGDAGQFPLAYCSEFVTQGAPNGFAAATSRTATNLLEDSEHYENATWTKSNITVSAATADLVDNKLGFRAARKLTATANNGYIESTYNGTSTGQYGYCVWVRGVGQAVNGALIQWDATGAAAVATQTFTAPADQWLLVWWASGTNANANSYWRLRIDTSGQSLQVCHFTVSGSPRRSQLRWPVLTYGTSAATPDIYVRDAPLASGDWSEGAGSFETYWQHPGGGVSQVASSCYMSLIDVGGGLDDVQLWENYDATRWWDSSSNVIVNTGYLLDNTQCLYGFKLYAEWDSQNDLASSIYARVAVAAPFGSSTSTLETTPWSAGDNIDGISLGQQGLSSATLDCRLIGYTKIWNTTGNGPF